MTLVAQEGMRRRAGEERAQPLISAGAAHPQLGARFGAQEPGRHVSDRGGVPSGPDGVAPVVDLVASPGLLQVRARARALLKEHASCSTVEVWCGGALVEQLGRGTDA